MIQLHLNVNITKIFVTTQYENIIIYFICRFVLLELLIGLDNKYNHILI